MAAMKSGELTLAELVSSAAVIHCRLCGSVYHEARLLPCLHSFCLDCLVSLLLRSQTSQKGTDAERKQNLPPSDLINGSQLMPTSSYKIQAAKSHDDENAKESEGELNVSNSTDANFVVGPPNTEPVVTDTDEESAHTDTERQRDTSRGHGGVNRGGYASRDNVDRGGADPSSVRLILREIQGRPLGREDVGPASRLRSSRPTSAKPGKSQPHTEQSATVATANSRRTVVTNRSTKDSTSKNAYTAIISTTKVVTDKPRMGGLFASLQGRRPRLSLACPTCDHKALLSGDILVHDDDEEDDDNTSDPNEYNKGEEKNTKKESDIRNRNVNNHVAPSEMTASKKLQAHLRKLVDASLPPNHFLNSLAKINRYKRTGPEISRDCPAGREGKQESKVEKENGGIEELWCAYCQTDKQNIPASSLCLDCDDRMCEACACAHRKTRVTRNHTMAPFTSIQSGLFDHDLRARGHVTCNGCSHHSAPVSHFCSDCVRTVCKRCRSGEHRAHQVSALPEGLERIAPELRLIQQAVSRYVPALTNYSAFLKGQMGKVTSTREALEKDVCAQARLVHEMIEEHKLKLLSRLQQACAEQTSTIGEKLQATLRSRDALSETSTFLQHLSRAGRADEILDTYRTAAAFHTRLVCSNGALGEGRRDDGSESTSPQGGPVRKNELSRIPGCSESHTLPGSSKNKNGKTVVNRDASLSNGSSDSELAESSSPRRRDGGKMFPSTDFSGEMTMSSRLACVFTPGPCTETNVGILLGALDLHTVPLGADDRTQPHLPLTSLMPRTLHLPTVQLTFQASAPSDRRLVYPSGLAVGQKLLGIVDRENALVKLFRWPSGEFLRAIKGEGERALVTPFDAVFLDKTGATLAVSDPGAGVVRVFESLTGRWIRDFDGGEGEGGEGVKHVRHPRGMVIPPGCEEVVVLDGHLRHLTFHAISTGRLLRRLVPTLGDCGNSLHHSLNNSTLGSDGTCINRENCNNDTTPTTTPTEEHKNGSSSPPASNQTNGADVTRFKSTALIDPYYVAMTLSGNLAVTDLASPNLKIIDRVKGHVLSQSMDYGTGGEESLHPSGLCVDRFGQILVTDTYNSRVHLALPNGQLTGNILLQDANSTLRREAEEVSSSRAAGSDSKAAKENLTVKVEQRALQIRVAGDDSKATRVGWTQIEGEDKDERLGRTEITKTCLSTEDETKTKTSFSKTKTQQETDEQYPPTKESNALERGPTTEAEQISAEEETGAHLTKAFPPPTVSKPVSVAIDGETGYVVLAQVGGQVKVIKYM